MPANFTFVVCPLDVAGAGNPGKCERNRVKIDSRNLSVQVGEKRERNGTEKNQAKQIKARTARTELRVVKRLKRIRTDT